MKATKTFSYCALVFCTACLFISEVWCSPPYKVVCYLGSWANYRNGDGKFTIEDIDPSLCTHLIYGFAKLDTNNEIVVYDPYLDLKENWGLGAFERFNALKERNPDLKTLLAIGGWNEGSTKYSAMAKSSAFRAAFVKSCVQMLTKYNFDGLDLDWEYPANRGGAPEDRTNFAMLAKELHDAFKPHNLLLTAAVSAGQQTIDSAYDVPALTEHLDFINLMTYDFHGGWDTTTGHNSPLFPRPDDSDANKKLTVDYAVRYWIKKGAPSQKLVLGMPLYGRSFSLQNPELHGLGSPVTGPGIGGRFTNEPGMLGFNEVCELLQDKSWTVVLDTFYKAPYMYKDNKWIAYDDIESIAFKVDYIKKMNLGGGMVWSIETDDFRGKCEGLSYPLLSTIRNGLNQGKSTNPELNTKSTNQEPNTKSTNQEPGTKSAKPEVTPTRKPTTATVPSASQPNRKISTTIPDGNTATCRRSGYFRDPNNCKIFYMCVPKSLSQSKEVEYYRYTYTCAPGTVFSEENKVCSFPRDVPECNPLLPTNRKGLIVQSNKPSKPTKFTKSTKFITPTKPAITKTVFVPTATVPYLNKYSRW